MFRPAVATLTAALAACALASTAVVAAPAQPEAQAAPPMVSLPHALRTAAAGPQSGPVTLRRTVSVVGDVVRLGDLFTGPMANPDRVVAHAPAAGRSLHLDAQWLASTARAAGLSWQPLGATDSTVVEREGRYVGSEEILAALSPTLVGQGMSPEAELEVTGTLQPIMVAADSAAMVEVIDTAYDSRSGRFSAVVALPGDTAGKPLRLSGRAYETMEVPVLLRSIQRDDVIGPDDVDWIKVRSQSVASGVATDPADVVGKAAQRTLRAGDPVRLRDLDDPALVEKGEMVTMVLKTQVMTLTAKGRSMEDAPLGATVRLQNLRSNKTVTGVVTAHRTVEIDTAQAAALR